VNEMIKIELTVWSVSDTYLPLTDKVSKIIFSV